MSIFDRTAGRLKQLHHVQSTVRGVLFLTAADRVNQFNWEEHHRLL